MSIIANPFVVILDANVLYPFRSRDILLRFAQKGLFRARWTDEIMDEWTRNLIANKPELEKSVLEQVDAIKEAFPSCYVVGYKPLISSLELPDVDDRHVLAAAIKCSAQHIVTENLKDFPEDILEEYDIYPIGTDEFLSCTFDLYPVEAVSILREMRKHYKNPSFNPSEFLQDLTAKGMPKLAARAREHIEYL